jgi:hypothetical protein
MGWRSKPRACGGRGGGEGGGGGLGVTRGSAQANSATVKHAGARTLKSTPIVACSSVSNVLSVKRSSRLDLPTAVSPTSSSFSKWSCSAAVCAGKEAGSQKKRGGERFKGRERGAADGGTAHTRTSCTPSIHDSLRAWPPFSSYGVAAPPAALAAAVTPRAAGGCGVSVCCARRACTDVCETQGGGIGQRWRRWWCSTGGCEAARRGPRGGGLERGGEAARPLLLQPFVRRNLGAPCACAQLHPAAALAPLPPPSPAFGF